MASNDGLNAAALFAAANKLRGSVESVEYKHLVLGLIFLKYISDAFESRRAELEAELSDSQSDGYLAKEAERTEVLEDRDEYVGKNVFPRTTPFRRGASVCRPSCFTLSPNQAETNVYPLAEGCHARADLATGRYLEDWQTPAGWRELRPLRCSSSRRSSRRRE